MSDSRKEFEAWVNSEWPNFSVLTRQAVWLGWQAARRAALEEAAKHVEEGARILSGSPGPLFDVGWSSASEFFAKQLCALAAQTGQEK